MTEPMILVTGASGKIGGAVVSQLREKGWPVRALVHRMDARAERLRAQGVEVVAADLFDPEQLLQAMRGTARTYYCPPWQPYMIQSAVAFAAAAREAKLESIVNLSQWLASPSHPSLATRQSWLADQMFAGLPGIAHTIVNPGFFADNYLRLIGFAAQLGIFPMPIGKSRNAPPSNEDIARVAAAALMDPARHAGRSYRPTGPALLSACDMTAILTRVLGRRVRHIDMPIWMFRKALRALNLSPFEQDSVPYYIRDHKRGAFELGGPTNDVLDVTGRSPEDFETIARRYAALPEAQRSFANASRAWADFMRIGMTGALDLDRYEREQTHPLPSPSRLAVDSDIWRKEHGMAPLAKEPPVGRRGGMRKGIEPA